MADAIRAYAEVRVRHLLQSPTDYDSWLMNQRAPRVGDVGTVVDILRAPGLPDRYVVECSDSDGTDVWLADFLREELEPVE